MGQLNSMAHLLISRYSLDPIYYKIFELLSFRQHPFAISAEIVGMFLQVRVYHVISNLWLFVTGGSHIKFLVHQYTRHIFGLMDSPTCANYALQRTPRDNAQQYPEAAKAVFEKFYMEDYLDSVESPKGPSLD